MSRAGRIRVSCIANKCSDQTLTLHGWHAVESFMDEHVREVAHDRRWPVTFRIHFLAQSSDQTPTVDYREPVKIT